MLLLLFASSVGLIHLVLDLAHAFCLLWTELLPFLVPAPLVHLAHTQAGQLTQVLESDFGPVGILVKLQIQILKLVA